MTGKQRSAIGIIFVLTLVLAYVILAPLRHEPSPNDQTGDGHATHASTQGDLAAGQRSTAGAPATLATQPVIRLTADQLQAAALETATVAPATLLSTLAFPGEIRLNDDRTAHVVARVNGVVEEVSVTLGQRVRKGQLMAVIASPTVSDQRSALSAALRRHELARSSFDREKRLFDEKISAEQDFIQARAALQEAEIAVANARQKLAAIGISPSSAGGNRFEVRAPFDGYVLEKHLVLGEAVREESNVYTLSDLSTVWADFSVTAADLNAVRDGARATVHAPSMGEASDGKVSYVGNLIGESTRTATARVTLPNPNGAWRAGLFVNVTIVAGERQVPLSVPNEAIQSVDGRPAVFVRTNEGFRVQPFDPGITDGRRTEVRAGLQSGDIVVTTNSFVLKAEHEKDSAEHTH